VIKDVGLDEPYQGIVKLKTGEIAEDIAYYLAGSEQIPSAVGLGVYVDPDSRVSAAGGFLIQSLPPADDNTIERLIGNIRKMPTVTQLLRSGRTPEEIIHTLFEGIEFTVLEKKGLSYQCTCSRKRIERILISLGCDELQKMKTEQEETKVTCEFCRTDYRFSRREMQELIGAACGRG